MHDLYLPNLIIDFGRPNGKSIVYVPTYTILGIQPVRCTGFIEILLNIFIFYYNIFIV